MNAIKGIDYIFHAAALKQVPVYFISEWYREFYQSGAKNILKKTISQINKYTELAVKRKRVWAIN